MIKSIIKYITIAITITISICYCLGLAAQWISPETWIIPTFLVMIMPIWIILMWVLIIIWCCCKKWIYASLLFIIMVTTFYQWRNVITINIPSKVNKTDSIKIITFNTHIFNSQKDDGFKEISKFIKETDADIVCLQEFGHYHKRGVSKQEILNFFDSIYPYRHIWFKNQNKQGENGIATFSRYPIIQKKKIEYKSADNISIYSDIVINNDTIRVINNHLESNKLNQKDRAIAQTLINSENNQKEKINAGIEVGTRFGSGAKNRVAQAKAVRKIINESKYPTITLGDFNDVPLSYTYHTIGENMQNAYTKAGSWGYHWTYNENFMLFAIDHILVDEDFVVTSSKVHREMKVSDHYPMSCTIQLKVEN